MPPITRSRSNLMTQANQQPAEHSPHGSAVNMPGAFNPENLLNLKASLDPLSINELTATEPAPKKPSRLDFNLDFSKHSARSVLHLSKNHAFKMLAGFCHAVAGSKSFCVLHSLIQILDYDIDSYAKIEQSYLDWEKK